MNRNGPDHKRNNGRSVTLKDEGEYMQFTKKIVAVVAGVAMCAGLTACGGSRTGQSGDGDKIEKGATIGISMPTKSEERWNKDGNNLKANLEKRGYKVILSFADDKPAQQNADIENMVNNDAKIVVVASKDGTAVGPAVEKARDAGAKVIAYDRLIMNTDAVDYYATFQLEQTGVLEATWLIDKLGLEDGATGPFNIELFAGSPDDNNSKYFFKGAWDLLQPYFEKGILVSPSNHGGGVKASDKAEDIWQKIGVQSWKAEQAQKDMEIHPRLHLRARRETRRGAQPLRRHHPRRGQRHRVQAPGYEARHRQLAVHHRPGRDGDLYRQHR